MVVYFLLQILHGIIYKFLNQEVLSMTLSAAQDIDFIMWGPFPNLVNAVANCNSYSAADIVPNLPAGCGGFFGPALLTRM